jgi:hypothetical protein
MLPRKAPLSGPQWYTQKKGFDDLKLTVTPNGDVCQDKGR